VRLRRPLLTTLAVLVAASALVAGCTTGTKNNGTGSRSATSPSASGPTSSTPTVAPAVLDLHPANGARNVSPATPIKASVSHGTITKARLVSSSGVVVKGALAPGRVAWESAEDLGYGKTYTLHVEAKNSAGSTVTKSSKFTTVTPATLTMPYLQDTAAGGIVQGGTYGIGMVVSIQFDEPIANKAAAERAISITSRPAVHGAFFWVNDQSVHWRPAHYWKPGTKVTVKANLYGVEVGNGLWGEQDKATHFTIGASHVAVADAQKHTVKVYWAGKLVRTMPTSMGRGGYVPGKGGQQISLWTPNGTYTVMNKQYSVVMDSESYGLPHSSPYGYKETIYWATRISSDGIFLHELMATTWAQGHVNVSHGCLNLNHVNAFWYYQHSLVGDVVKVVHSGGAPLRIWQNGDWTLSWSAWIKGGVNRS
jgi:lipoprotein-anchoring transpeptidase ErfK/SrfK